MKDRFNLAFPSLLLVCVAIVQIARAKEVQQSAWKGGGFGMFSTADSPDGRFVRCVLTGPTGEYRVQLPGILQGTVARTLAVPSDLGLDELAQAALKLQWVKEDYASVRRAEGGAGPGRAFPGETAAVVPGGRAEASRLSYRALDLDEPPPPAELLLEVTKVRLEIWRTRLGADGSTIEAVRIGFREVEP